jgi:hypothetical protein
MLFREKKVERPIILLGAARSGTKMLRAAIAAHPRISAIPHDINFIWKYGNFALPHDELEPRHLQSGSRRYIQRFFAGFQAPLPGSVVVEKTVSNTLRIPFVRAVFPDCRFIHILRDGRDVSASARRMWQAPLDWQSALEKVRLFPLRGLPSYARQYLQSYLIRTLSAEKRMSSWGPRFAGIDEKARSQPLLETCGEQWRRCVEAAFSGLKDVPGKDVLQLRYEEFVDEPLRGMQQIISFLGLPMTAEVERHARNMVSTKNVDKWKKEVAPGELEGLLDAIGETLEAHGYAL